MRSRVKLPSGAAGGEKGREADVRRCRRADRRRPRGQCPGRPCHGDLRRPRTRICRKPFPATRGSPQALFNKRVAEADFYEAFFATVSHWATDLAAVVEIAMREASTNGVEAMDALHVAAAASVGASELITTEKSSRSIHRARSVKVVTIYPGA